MAIDDEPNFGTLLKRYRRAAHLTQEDLAERAGYSSHYVSMLEREVRLAQPLTVDLLADALRLRAKERAALHAAADARPSRVVTLPGIPTLSFPLIGREGDIVRMIHVLGEDDVRLLTLTGPGGVGKTVLAQHIATALYPVFGNGAAFVDLTAVNDPDDVIPNIGRALGLRPMAGRSIQERLIGFLQEHKMLLVLDCFERVVDAAAAVGDILAPCPGIKLLVTSRVPLRLRAEREFRVPPLALPGPDESQPAPALLQSPAVALFVQRALLARPDLAIGDEQAAVIADICRRVDGLPLAIELAAARLTHLSLVALRDRLQHRLQVLTGGTRDLPARQHTMWDTIAWSYELLTPPPQALFRQLSVFAGSWSLEAAEEVCIPAPSADAVLDEVRSLVENSLIIAMDNIPDEPRYRMLDTIHEYAGEQLAASGELDVMRRRHSTYYVRLAEQAERALQDRDQHVWYPRLEREHDNLRAALGRLLQVGDVEAALRLAGAIWRFWQRHGDVREGRRWLEEGLARREHVSAQVRAKALWGASWLAYHQGDYARTRALSTEHLALAREQGDALSTRNALTGLGMAASAEGRYIDAVALLQEALDVCLPLGDIWHCATSAFNLGHATMLAGDLTRAATLLGEALARYRERGDAVFTARACQHLGYVALLRDEYTGAEALFAQSLQALFDLEEKPGIADGLEAVAAVRAAKGQARQAGQLVEAASMLRERVGVVPLPYLLPVWHAFVAKAKASLGEAAWTAAREEGRGMSLQEAVAVATGGYS